MGDQGEPSRHLRAYGLTEATWGDHGFFNIAYGQIGIDAAMWAPEIEGGTSSVTSFTYRERDRGRTASFTVGTRFFIELKENPTTGYKWSAPEFDERSLTLEVDNYTPAGGAAIGGGGIRKFGFLVKSASRTTIHLAYRRPWEKDAAPDAVFELTIVGT
jgi:inhibitor of cysteine peptidase